jgi:hypothetical protein
MSWSENIIPILRVFINDSNSSAYVYDDARLIDILLVGARYIQHDITFPITYTIDIVNKTITPDPSTDDAFTNFMVVRAACFADFSTFRSHALIDGVTAKLGSASLTVLNRTKAFKDLITIGPCSLYESMQNDYVYGSGQLCKAVMGPFISNTFNPEWLGWWGGSPAGDSRYNYFS